MPSVGSDNRYPSRRLLFVGIAFVVVVAAAAGAGIWDRRQEAIAHARRDATDLDVILAGETARSLQTIDLVLREIQAKIATAASRDPERLDHLVGSEAVHEFLRRRLRDLPQADLVGLIAADGRLRNSSQAWPAAAVDLSNRDYFDYLHAHDDADAYIGAPAIPKDAGIGSFSLARRIDAADGRFLGVAVIAVDVDYLERNYRSIVARTGGAIGLLRRDGTVLARYPETSAGLADLLPQYSGLNPSVEKGGGAVEAAGRFDGNQYIVARRPLDRFDLVVAVAVPEAAALAAWRRRSTAIAIGAICVAVIFALLFGALSTRTRSLERSEAGLRESEARFRDFALTSSDWFWETDAQHRFVYQSEEIREFGQDPRKRLGRLRIDLAADAAEEPEKWRDHMAVLNRHEPFRDFVYERRIGADPPHIIAVSGNPVFDRSRRFLGYRGTTRNITEKVLAERSLRAAKAAAESANLAKSNFLANISHELRTPLNAILGFAELLERGAAGPLPPPGPEYAGLIRQSGVHLLEIINRILDLARIDAGKLELHEERGIDPRRLIEQCVRLVEPQAEAAALQLSVEIADPVPLLVADRNRLAETLLILLSNAIKFTEPGGSVAIAMRCTADGEPRFDVRDTGIGMAETEIEIALEPFGQVDPGLGRRSTGTGLGLPLARRLAELHGGSLDIRSEKGVGTTATLLLPATRVLDDTAAAEALAGTAAGGG
jgi:PAS domain S-box-containing protein